MTTTPFFESIYEDPRHMFWFTSVGKETIVKVVLFRPTDQWDTYEMVLGDLNPDGSIDVEMRSNNGDTEFVLSTAAKAVMFFLSDHLDAQIVIEATTSARARLYQITIKKEVEILGDYFDIYGCNDQGLEQLQSGKNYLKFIVMLRKKID